MARSVNIKRACDCCKKIYNSRSLVIIKGQKLCDVCRKRKTKNKMPQYIPNDIPKSYLPPKLKVRIKVVRDPSQPIMKGAKKPVIVTNKVHLYLTKDEKYVLWKKLTNMGFSREDASERVVRVANKMGELALKIKQEAKVEQLTTEQMNMKFIEGLEKYSNEVMV